MPAPYSALNFAAESFKGVNLTAAADQVRPGECTLCQNATMDLVGQLSTRAGSVRVGPATGHSGYLHSIFYISDDVSAYPVQKYLYVIGVGSDLLGYDGAGGWTTLASSFSGKPLTGVIYKLAGTGQPWLILGDSAKMVKIGYVSGSWTVYQLGITPPPTVASVTVLPNQLTLQIDLLVVGGSPYVVVNGAAGTPSANGSNPSTVVRSSGVVTWTGTATENFVQGLVGEVAGFLGPDASLNGTFEITGITSSSIFTYNQPAADLSVAGSGEQFISGLGTVVNSGATATMSRPLSINLTEIDGNPSLDSDLIKVWVFLDDVTKATDFQILFDIDPSSVSGGSLTSTAFTRNYYSISVFSSLSNGWNQISVAKSAFTREGQGTYDWSGVVASQFKCVAASGETPEFFCNDMYLQGASYPNSSVGIGYDWRYTFYDSVSQSESNPSPIMAVDAYPVNQPVELIPGVYSSDPQVNQIRWYRRGGTLASNWYLLGAQPNSGALALTSVSMDAYGAVATFLLAATDGLAAGDPVVINGVGNPAFDGLFTVATVTPNTSFTVQNLVAGAGTTSSGGTVSAVFIDGQSDTEIATAPVLSLQNDVPVTTIDESGTIVYAQPLSYIWGPLGGTAIFGDGDPNQPSNLYWCNAGNPDGWGSLNFLQVTQPSDPLTLGVYWQGNSWARSMESLYQITPSNVPGFYTCNDIGSGESVAVPWAVLGGSGVPFMPWVGKSGIFIGSGGVGQSLTDDRLWPLFDPKSTRPDAVNWNVPSQIRLAWYDHHIFWCYQGIDGTNRAYRFDNQRGYWDGPHVWWFGLSCLYNQPEVQETLLLGGKDGNLYAWDTAATTDAGTAIVPLIQTQVYRPAGWENDCELGHLNLDAAAPVGGIAVTASFNVNQTSYVSIGSAVSTSRATTPFSLLDTYALGVSLEFTWSGPGSIYGFSVLYRNDGQKISHAEVPATSYGTTDFQHLYRANIALRSTGIVNCSVVVDNVELAVQLIPSTGNTRLRQQLFFPLNKGQLYQIKLDAAVANQGWKIYPEDCSAEFLGWSEVNCREVALPFTGGFTS